MDREHYQITEDEFKRIIEICNKKLVDDPNDLEVITRKGMSLSGLNRHDDAVICFDRALEIDPNYEWALHNKCVSLS